MAEADWPKIEADLVADLAEAVRLGIMTRAEADVVHEQLRNTAWRERPRQALRARWRAADALEEADPANADIAAEMRARVREEAKALGIPDGIP